MDKKIIKATNTGYRRGYPRRQRCAVGKRRPGEILTAAARHRISRHRDNQSAVNRPYWEKSYSGGPIDVKPLPPVLPGKGYKPVVVPNGGALPFKVVDGVKVFHLIAEEVDHFFDAGLRAKCWGFNGRVNSTVIEAVEGERVRIYVTNRLAVCRLRFTGMASICPTAWTASAG